MLEAELARVSEELDRQLGEKAAFAAAAVEQQARAEKAEAERDEALIKRDIALRQKGYVENERDGYRERAERLEAALFERGEE